MLVIVADDHSLWHSGKAFVGGQEVDLPDDAAERLMDEGAVKPIPDPELSALIEESTRSVEEFEEEDTEGDVPGDAPESEGEPEDESAEAPEEEDTAGDVPEADPVPEPAGEPEGESAEELEGEPVDPGLPSVDDLVSEIIADTKPAARRGRRSTRPPK